MEDAAGGAGLAVRLRLPTSGMLVRVLVRATVPLLESGLGSPRGVGREAGGGLGGVVGVVGVVGRVVAREWVSRARGADSSRVRNPAASGRGGDLVVGAC